MGTGTGTPAATGDAGHYFTLTELRASDAEFASTTDYPDVKLEAARDWAEQRFEMAARCSFVPHAGATFTTIGNDDSCLVLPHLDVTAVTAVTVGSHSLTAAELSDLVVYPYGMVKRHGGWPGLTAIVVTYNYGKSAVPAPVKQALLILCREYLVANNLGSRKTSESTEVGVIRYSFATAGGKVGIPEVDAVIADYGHGSSYTVG